MPNLLPINTYAIVFALFVAFFELKVIFGPNITQDD